jgi:hypothetical protein
MGCLLAPCGCSALQRVTNLICFHLTERRHRSEFNWVLGRGEITRCISMGFWIGLAIVATIVAFLAVWIIAAMRKVAKLVSPSRD